MVGALERTIEAMMASLQKLERMKNAIKTSTEFLLKLKMMAAKWKSARPILEDCLIM